MTKENLIELYVNLELSTRDIAKIYNVGQTTVRRKLSEFEIETRSSKEGKNTKTYLNKAKELSKRYKEDYSNRALKTGNRLKKICPICNSEFETPKSVNRKYCSKEYQKIGTKLLLTEKFKNSKKNLQNHCRSCNKLLPNHWSKYCPECLVEHKKELFTKKIKTHCAYCNKEIEVIPYTYKKNKYNYCNVECMSKHYVERFSGENSPSWKGGKRHYLGHWLRQSKLARERDNNTCQICGKTAELQGYAMSVHHIVNYRLFNNKEEANNLDNLICLCHECHTFVHSNKNTEKLYINDKILSNPISNNG